MTSEGDKEREADSQSPSGTDDAGHDFASDVGRALTDAAATVSTDLKKTWESMKPQLEHVEKAAAEAADATLESLRTMAAGIKTHLSNRDGDT